MTQMTQQAQGSPLGQSQRMLAYLLLGFTLVVAIMELAATLRGKPSSGHSRAMLITLFCISLSQFVQTRRLKMALAVAGIAFALVAIYLLVTG